MKTQSFIAIFLLVASLFMACETDKIIPDSEDPFDLKYEHTAILYDGDLRLQFIEVVQDSRCPEGAECIWAGNVTVRLTAEQDSSALTDTLTLDLGPDTENNERNPVTYAAYTINLLDVKPYPKVGKDISLQKYELELQVTK